MTFRVKLFFFSVLLQLQIIWHMTLRSSRAFRPRAGAVSIHRLCCLQAPYREGTRVIFMRLHVNLFNESSTSGFVWHSVTAFHPTWQNDLYRHWKMRPLLPFESVTVSVRYTVFVRPCRQKSLSRVITCILWLRFVSAANVITNSESTWKLVVLHQCDSFRWIMWLAL